MTKHFLHLPERFEITNRVLPSAENADLWPKRLGSWFYAIVPDQEGDHAVSIPANHPLHAIISEKLKHGPVKMARTNLPNGQFEIGIEI
jgi:hypothetical protein